MYVFVTNLLVLTAVIHTTARLSENLTSSTADLFVATTAATQRPVTDLDAWLHRIRDGTREQRMEAAANLPSNTTSERVIDALRDATDDNYIDVRAAAIYSLGDLGDIDVVPLLHNKLASRAPQVRSAAIWALTSLGNTDAQEQIGKLLFDANDGVRIAAS